MNGKFFVLNPDGRDAARAYALGCIPAQGG